MPQKTEPKNETSTLPLKKHRHLSRQLRFFKSWLVSPKGVGAVMPSGPALAKAMAKCVDAADDRLIVELGPGTGPVTKALLAHGISPERLILVEYDAGFCHMLQQQFPHTHVVKGDAYHLTQTLKNIDRPIAAVVSSLPLLNRPEKDRIDLLQDAFTLMGEEGLFIQFTYGMRSPIPLNNHSELTATYSAERSAPIWRNVPPARVWRYRMISGRSVVS